MKKRCTLILFFILSSFVIAQNKQLLFGFKDIPQRQLLNPGSEIENDWYFGIPLLSHIHANVGSTGVTVFDLFANDGRDFNTKLREAIFSLDYKDYFVANEQITFFSGGFSFGPSYKKNQYISFGMYHETDLYFNFPEDYAVLAYEGNFNAIDRVFNLGNIFVKAETLSVFHVGYSKTVSKKLTIGARAKIYSSIANVNSTQNQGRFITTQGDNNLLNQNVDLDLQLQTSGVSTFINDENEDIGNDIRSRFLLGGNLGLGFDLGFTYNFSDQLSLEASIQDLGFITHTKDVENYGVEGTFNFEGINPLFPQAQSGQTSEEYLNDIINEFKDVFKVDTTQTKYTTWRPLKLNTSLVYRFGQTREKDCNCLAGKSDYINEIGGHVFIQNRPIRPQLALTAYYFRRLFSGLDIKASYTVDSFSFSNLGLGLSSHIGPINFYLLADNILSYNNIAKSKSVSIQLGFNYIFKRKTK